VVDDESGIRSLLSRVLTGEGYDVASAANGKKGLEQALATRPDVMLLDMKMPEMDGMQVLERVVEAEAAGAIIIMTAHSTVASAVKAIKLGAFDYLCKPFDVDEVLVTVEKAREVADLRSEVAHLRTEVSEKYGPEAIVGRAPRMVEILDLLPRVAQSRSTVLITGESGTGKELIARAIHHLSPRSKRRFVKVNCAALSENLLESELFGHVKGSFTGATQSRVGRFQMADGGSILLDEISELTPKLQAKLLRVLQEREFEPVGSSDPVRVDVRILATTNQDLQDSIRRGTFREDLYFRLNVVCVEFPPLRERPEDIPLLARHFLNRFSEETNKRVDGISDDAIEILKRHFWPGNVRELQNVIERGVVLCQGREIGSGDLPPAILEFRKGPGGSLSVDGDLPDGTDPLVGTALRDVERCLILKTLDSCDGNRTRAADILGISARTLRNKLKEYRENAAEREVSLAG
jgi:DNA-binding NtrC family response regulator